MNHSVCLFMWLGGHLPVVAVVMLQREVRREHGKSLKWGMYQSNSCKALIHEHIVYEHSMGRGVEECVTHE